MPVSSPRHNRLSFVVQVRSTSVRGGEHHQRVCWPAPLRSLRRLLPVSASCSTQAHVRSTSVRWRTSPTSLLACTSAHSDVYLWWPLLILQHILLTQIRSTSVRSLRCLALVSVSSTQAHSIERSWTCRVMGSR